MSEWLSHYLTFHLWGVAVTVAILTVGFLCATVSNAVKTRRKRKQRWEEIMRDG